MAEYIKREDALRFALFCVRNILDSNISLQDKFDEIPSADVVEVRHGRWINGECSECGGDAPFWPMATTYYCSNFCPHCNADMRGGT